MFEKILGTRGKGDRNNRTVENMSMNEISRLSPAQREVFANEIRAKLDVDIPRMIASVNIANEAISSAMNDKSLSKIDQLKIARKALKLSLELKEIEPLVPA